MGFLNFRKEKVHLKRIQAALKRRGLTMKQADDWEVHGPHHDMNYQVFIGPAYRRGKWDCIAVVYPWAVYGVSQHSEWSQVSPADRIPVKKDKPSRVE